MADWKGKPVRRLACLLLTCLLPTSTWAAGHSTVQEITGTIGGRAVGGIIAITGDGTLGSAHYFYVDQLTDIPLSGSVTWPRLTLSDPDGNVFQLRLADPQAPSGQELTLDTATDLEGTWTGHGRSLPVVLHVSWERDGSWPMRLYGDVTSETDVVFESHVRRFIAAVLAGDRTAAAGFVSLPLRVNGASVVVIRTKSALLRRWSRIFTPYVIGALRRAVPHEMFVHEGQAMIGNGEVWFDAKGVMAINQIK